MTAQKQYKFKIGDLVILHKFIDDMGRDIPIKSLNIKLRKALKEKIIFNVTNMLPHKMWTYEIKNKDLDLRYAVSEEELMFAKVDNWKNIITNSL